MPGLVNTHTHLELTGLDGEVTDDAFADWIRTIVRLKYAEKPLDFHSASRQGVRQSFASGVTTVADTGDSGAPFEALIEQHGSGIAYLEVFGPDPSAAAAQFDVFRTRVLEMRSRQTDRVRIGVSPHAPYSVSGPLYTEVARFADAENLPIAVHIAESAEESALLETASGPFADMWKGRGIPLPAVPGRTPLAWLEELGVLGPHTLCIHAVRAGPDDIARLARHCCAVAHCPRSNRRHGHGEAPLRALLAAGLRVGAGTDSAASVSPVDLLAEARAAAALAGLSPEEALRLVMLGAAEALGLEQEVGSIEIGKWADLAVIGLPAALQAGRLPEAILASRGSEVQATFVGGREVHRQS